MKSELIPEGATTILFRHPEKTNNDGSREGELTILGKRQGASTSIQLLERFGPEKLQKAIKLASPVFRVKQMGNIALAMWDSTHQGYIDIPELEWGPGYPDHAEYIINMIASYGKNAFVVVFGHDGLFNNMAARLHPGQRYNIGRGCAFIITQDGVEVIEPQV